jgi:hypothetical protein
MFAIYILEFLIIEFSLVSRFLRGQLAYQEKTISSWKVVPEYILLISFGLFLCAI